MLRHLIEDDSGRRQFDYANTPLGWAFTVLRTLLADDHAELAEDLAAKFFRAEQQWDRWSQLNATVRWLKSLPESRGAVMARAIRRGRGRRLLQPADRNRPSRQSLPRY